MKSTVRICNHHEWPKIGIKNHSKYMAVKNAFIVAASEVLGDFVEETSHSSKDNVYLCKTLGTKRRQRWNKVKLVSISRRYVTVEKVD